MPTSSGVTTGLSQGGKFVTMPRNLSQWRLLGYLAQSLK